MIKTRKVFYYDVGEGDGSQGTGSLLTDPNYVVGVSKRGDLLFFCYDLKDGTPELIIRPMDRPMNGPEFIVIKRKEAIAKIKSGFFDEYEMFESNDRLLKRLSPSWALDEDEKKETLFS
jgi:hypothetical protein